MYSLEQIKELLALSFDDNMRTACVNCNIISFCGGDIIIRMLSRLSSGWWPKHPPSLGALSRKPSETALSRLSSLLSILAYSWAKLKRILV